MKLMKLDIQFFGASASVSCTEKSQNIATNETIVRITFTVTRTSGTTHWNDAKKLTFKITYLTDSGTETFTQDTYFSFPSGSVGASKSNYIEVALPHKSDGTQYITYSATIATGTSIGTLSPSSSNSLTTIPRASVLGTISNFTLGNAITIPITKYSGSFSDTLYVYIGNTLITMFEGITNNQSINFTAAELNTIYNVMSNTTSATFRFDNYTYNGSNIVGATTKTAIGTINTDIVRPSFPTYTVIEASGVVPSEWGIFVRNKSKLKFDISATPGTGASISSITTKIDGKSYNGSSITTEPITTAGSLTVDISATDSRGITSSSARGITIVDYDNPYVTSASAIRSDLYGESDTGTYLRVDLKAGVYSVDEHNTATFKVQYKKTTEDSWTEHTLSSSALTYDGYVRIPGLDTNSSYDVQIVVTDYFTTVIKVLPTIPTAFTTVDYLNGGHGIAFGKVAEEEDLMDVNFNAKFRGKVEGDFNTYSTEEKVVGIWKDNKPIYRKYVSFSKEQGTEWENVYLPDFGITNVDTIWFANGSHLLYDSRYTEPYDNDTIYIEYGSHIHYVQNEYYTGVYHLVLEYTKTTD